MAVQPFYIKPKRSLYSFLSLKILVQCSLKQYSTDIACSFCLCNHNRPIEFNSFLYVFSQSTISVTFNKTVIFEIPMKWKRVGPLDENDCFSIKRTFRIPVTKCICITHIHSHTYTHARINTRACTGDVPLAFYSFSNNFNYIFHTFILLCFIAIAYQLQRSVTF